MVIALNQLDQVSLGVNDVGVAEEFYSQKLGLRKLYRFGDLVFYDCAGVRLFLEKSRSQPFVPNGSVLYFRTPDITVAVRELEARGVSFTDKPHLIAPMEDHDLWMTFFKDPAGNTLALMQEAPKGYKPQGGHRT
jgi:methylmalonyl-CoA/ethylmalonyl-CoA epimerase